MGNELKYRIWNLPSYIVKLESRENLTDKDLESISGGLMNKKLTASVLAGLSVLTGVTKLTEIRASTTRAASISQNKIKNQDINFEITKGQAVEDINYVLKVIKDNHVSSVEKIPDEVTNQAKAEIENLADKVSVVDEWRIVLRILSKLHDAHTTVLAPKFLNRRLPFDTEYDSGKFICKSGDFKGCEITAINDIEIEKLYKIFQNHCPHEIDELMEYRFFEAPSDFIPELKLAYCGIDTSKPIKVSFKTKDGVQSQDFKMQKIETSNGSPEHWISYEIDEKNSIGIFKLDRCYMNDEYMQTLFNFLKEISEKKIKNIAIDLRKNAGGDSMPGIMFAVALKHLKKFKCIVSDVRDGDKLLRNSNVMAEDDIEEFRVRHFGKNYDKSILFDGNVFILTSHHTFSSAVDFAEYFQDNKLGTVVGEIPGNSPEHFGNLVLRKDARGNTVVGEFKMPNSKLGFTTTFKKFYRIDETKDGTKLIPDVQVPAKDALNKVYEMIAGKRK